MTMEKNKKTIGLAMLLVPCLVAIVYASHQLMSELGHREFFF